MAFNQTKRAIELVNKTKGHVARYFVDDLTHADLFEATNVRDETTWTLVKQGATEEEAIEWTK